MAGLITSDELVPEPHALVRDAAPETIAEWKALLITDVNTIRETNNAIFDDIFWVHLA